MADASTRRIRDVIDELVREGYLFADDEKYGVLSATARAVDFIKNERTIRMKLARETERTKGKEKPKKPSADERRETERINLELFEKLKKLRAAFAEEANVPAYVVFTDASLRDMCRRLPKTREEFMLVSGVGEVKAKRYAEAFLDALR
jgi:ATP-dependent DNA helicase RecQ